MSQVPDAPARSDLVPETVLVDTRSVWCDGSDHIRAPKGVKPVALGHPRVYMQIDERGFVDCGYCDRRFVLEETPAARGLSEAGAGDLPPPSDATVA
ncbi:MAG: zinc-finger domain-containing protein [Sphingomonadales bacterium CG12_big_fil_rev_8_21_14_0_65_65_10]|nr:MAG: zinc-finger domain-containing protein [Sphingomonadales bacterium CG12_big_fil_rev_8_21_14_0_65_65_10]